MAKIYSKKTEGTNLKKPDKETVSFLLSYSKALNIVKGQKVSFEIMAN